MFNLYGHFECVGFNIISVLLRSFYVVIYRTCFHIFIPSLSQAVSVWSVTCQKRKMRHKIVEQETCPHSGTTYYYYYSGYVPYFLYSERVPNLLILIKLIIFAFKMKSLMEMF